jgi:hypothetical protein
MCFAVDYLNLVDVGFDRAVAQAAARIFFIMSYAQLIAWNHTPEKHRPLSKRLQPIRDHPARSCPSLRTLLSNSKKALSQRWRKVFETKMNDFFKTTSSPWQPMITKRSSFSFGQG